jgi:hypothetical protein
MPLSSKSPFMKRPSSMGITTITTYSNTMNISLLAVLARRMSSSLGLCLGRSLPLPQHIRGLSKTSSRQR